MRAAAPCHAPSPAISQMSPTPIASFRVTRRPIQATSAKAAKPPTAPSTDDRSVPAWAIPSAAATRPVTTSGRVSAPGRSHVARSMNASASSRSTITSSASAGSASPCRCHASHAAAAPSSSTATYRGEIAVPQRRQRPRRTSHESTGMLSYQAIAARHSGHRERGRTIDSPAGTRAMTTFRKLPIVAPTTSTHAPIAMRRASESTSR